MLSYLYIKKSIQKFKTCVNFKTHQNSNSFHALNLKLVSKFKLVLNLKLVQTCIEFKLVLNLKPVLKFKISNLLHVKFKLGLLKKIFIVLCNGNLWISFFENSIVGSV